MAQNPSIFRLRNILLALGAVLAVGAAVLLSSDDARRTAELRAAEVAGEVATRAIASRSEGSGHAADFIAIPVEVRQLDDVLFQARGVGNTQLVATSEGHVVFDTGLATQGKMNHNDNKMRLV